MRKSADIKINDKLKDIKIGLTLTSKDLLQILLRKRILVKYLIIETQIAIHIQKLLYIVLLKIQVVRIKITVVYDHLFLLKKIQKIKIKFN